MHCKYLPLFHTKPQKSFLRLCMGQREVLTVHAFFRPVMTERNESKTSTILHKNCLSGQYENVSLKQDYRYEWTFFMENASFHSSVKTSRASFHSLFRRKFAFQIKRIGSFLDILSLICSLKSRKCTIISLQRSLVFVETRELLYAIHMTRIFCATISLK